MTTDHTLVPEQPASNLKAPAVPEKKKSQLTDILVTVVLPSLILAKLSSPDRLGQQASFWLALSLPFFYGLWELLRERSFNGIAVLGVVSVLLTGGLGFLGADGIWFAIKEASIPTLLGIAVVFTLKSKKSFVRKMLYNDKIMNVELIESKLADEQQKQKLLGLVSQTGWFFAVSLFLSAVLNFLLAFFMLKSPAGTTEFNQELGKMNALSYPVIVLPCMVVLGFALWRLVSGIKKMTGLNLEQILKEK